VGSLTNALIVVVCIDIMMFMVMGGYYDTAGVSTTKWSCSGSIFGTSGLASGGNCDEAINKANSSLSLDTNYYKSAFPSSTTSGSTSAGQFFMNIWDSIKDAIVGGIGVMVFLTYMLGAPFNILGMMGLPSGYVYMLCTLWYIINIFLLVAWWKGGDA
jgi:hypothetical protein